MLCISSKLIKKKKGKKVKNFSSIRVQSSHLSILVENDTHGLVKPSCVPVAMEKTLTVFSQGCVVSILRGKGDVLKKILALMFALTSTIRDGSRSSKTTTNAA